MHHKVDSPSAIKRSALFPAFEADAMIAMIEHEPLGQDEVPDLILMNYKCADFVGHKYGPNSPELRATLGEMDRHLARILAALEAKVGRQLSPRGERGPRHAVGARFAGAAAFCPIDRGSPCTTSSIPRRRLWLRPMNPKTARSSSTRRACRISVLTLRDLTRFLDSQPFVFAAFTREDIQHAR
jgi:hypothetical protein